MTKTLRDAIRAALGRSPHGPYDGDPFDPPALPEERVGAVCRCCPERAEVELYPDVDILGAPRSERLCLSCLGTFVKVFADPRVSTWVVTRL